MLSQLTSRVIKNIEYSGLTHDVSKQNCRVCSTYSRRELRKTLNIFETLLKNIFKIIGCFLWSFYGMLLYLQV